MRPSHISFDVFDTCLTRSVALPADVFNMMAAEVAVLAGVSISQQWSENFLWARIRGEALARECNPSGEVDLNAIWKIVRKILRLPERAYERLEIEWEERLSVPIPKAKAEIKAARGTGAQIVFLSDMYLPSDFIEKLLRKHDFFQDGDKLFVSSEFNASKSGGELFLIVSRKLGLTSTEILHYGDNSHSDFRQAIAAGWNAKLVSWAALTQVELRLRHCEVSDKNKISRLAAAMRFARMSGAEDSGDASSQFVTPFLYVFVDWVLNKAEMDGVERLYFLGRDCQLAWEFANHKVLKRDRIECRYLHASRRTYYPATIQEVSPAGIPWLHFPWEKPILKRLIDKVGVTEVEFNQEWKRFFPGMATPVALDSNEDWANFWTVLQGAQISNLILSKASIKRAKLRSFLIQEGLLDGPRCAFVDLGWNYGIQRSAEFVLQEIKPHFQLRGYYLGSNFAKWEQVMAESLFPPPIPGSDGGAYAGKPNQYANLLEHILGFATHGSLLDFSKMGDCILPVFDLDDSHASSQNAKSHQANALVSLEFFAELRGLFTSDMDARAALASLMSEIFENPTDCFVDEVKAIMVSEDANGHGSKKLAEPYTCRELLKSIVLRITRRKSVSGRKREWAAGSLAITPRYIRWIARRLGTIKILINL